MKIRHLGKILAVVFFMLLFAVVLTVSVGAEEIKAEDHANLQAAIDAAAAGDIVVVSQDYSLSGPLNITKALTIQGEGAITAPYTVFNVKTGGAFVIGGNLKCVSQNGCGISVNNTTAGANITFKDSVSFETKDNCLQDSDSVSGTITVNIEGGSLKSNSKNGFYFGYGSADATIEVTGGEITAAGHCFFSEKSFAGDLKLTVKGGKLKASTHAIYFKTNVGKVEITIAGGAFTPGNAVVCLNDLAGGATVTVSGGDEFTHNGNAFHIINMKSEVDFTVSGGTFNTKINVFGFFFENNTKKMTVTVKGNASFEAETHVIYAKNCTGALDAKIEGGTFKANNTFIATNNAPATITMTGGTVQSCGVAFRLMNAASSTVGETGMHSVVNVSGSVAITATGNLVALTNGQKASVTFTGGAGLVYAKTPFNVDASSTLNKTINGASYVNGDYTVYTSFGTALTNVPENGTVTVVGNVVLTVTASVTKSVTVAGTGTVTMKSGVNAPIFTITAPDVSLTLNGAVTYSGDNAPGVSVRAAGATVNYKGDDIFNIYRNIVLIENISTTSTTTVNMESGSFTSTGGNIFHIGKNSGNLIINISGGTYHAGWRGINALAGSGDITLTVEKAPSFSTANNCFNFESANAEVNVTVKGGTFTAGGALVCTNNTSAAFTMTGGSATVAALTSGTGVNTEAVTGATYTNEVGKVVYTSSLATAVANVVSDGTVTVYGDHTASLSVTKGMTIKGTGSVTAEWTVFNVRAAAAGATINLDGSVRYVSQKGVGFSVQGSGITFNFKGNDTFTTQGNVMQDAGSMGAGGTITVNVKSGTFKSVGDNCFRFGLTDTNGRALTTVDMTVSGGTFEAKNAFVCISGAAADIVMAGGKVSTCTNGFNAYGKVEGTPALESGDNVKVTLSGEARINATQFVLSSTGGYKASIGLESIGGYIQAKKLYNVDASSVLVDTVAEPYVQYVGEGRVGIGHIRSAAANAAPGSTLTVYGTTTIDGALDITKSLTFTGEGTISTQYTTFNVKNNENIVLIVGGDLKCISREGVGVSIGAANAKITFKDNVTVHTKGNFIQDSSKVVDGTVTVNILGGTFHSESNGIYFRDSTGMAIINITGGTISAAAHCICTHVFYAGSARINITGGKIHALGANASYCVHLGDTANEASVACNIYGGTFLNDAGYANVCSASNTNDVEADKAPRVNIYGGYFEGNRSACVQAVAGGVVNIWGGYFRYVGAKNVFGSPVISGSGSESKGTVNVYGGNFVSEASGPAFSCANAVSVLNLYSGYNANGGGYLVNNKNTNGGTPATGYPVGQQHYAASIYMTDGAGVRISDDSNGLRFVSVITAEALAYIESIADGGSISYGTLISPVDLVQQADSFTHDGMTRAGVKFVDVPAKNGLVARADGGYYIRAAIINILPENIDREFAAVSYVKYTVNGREVIVYSVYREHKNARSIQQVARLALEEAELYTAEQLEVLRAYAPEGEAPVIDFYLIAGQSNAAGSTNFQDDFANSDPNFKNGYSNVYYSGLAMSGSGISSKMAHSCVPVKIGYGNSGTNFGPELGLADALSTHYNAESGKYAAVIKYAYSGICLRDNLQAPADAEGNWCPPSWLAEHGALDPVLSGQHYRAFVKYIEECIADYEAMGFKVNIVAAYWMQGEQDVSWNGTAGLYDELLTCLINDLRKDVAQITGDEKYLKLPVMIGELSAYLSELSNNQAHFNNTAALIQAQHDVAAALENVYVLDQSNLPSFDIEPGEKASNKDRYHWISHNMLWIGQQLGYTALEDILGVNVQLAEEDIVAKVYLGEELIGSYTNLVGAISHAPEGATVKLTRDVTMYSTLVIGNTNTITLDGCGYSLTFVVPTNVNTGSGEKNENCGAFRLYATDLTVTNLSVSLNVDVAGVYKLFGAEVEWVDCAFVQQGTEIEAFTEVVISSTVVMTQNEN